MHSSTVSPRLLTRRVCSAQVIALSIDENLRPTFAYLRSIDVRVRRAITRHPQVGAAQRHTPAPGPAAP